MKKNKYSLRWLHSIKKRFHSLVSANRSMIRLAVTGSLLGLNIVLGIYFIRTNRVHLPNQVITVLDQTGLVEKADLDYLANDEKAKKQLASLEPTTLLSLLNQERTQLSVSELELSDRLSTVAGEILLEVEKQKYNLDNQDFTPILKKALETTQYHYLHVSHNVVIGPLTEQAIIDAWFSDDRQIQSLGDPDFADVGFATKVVNLDGIGTVGVVVDILGREAKSGAVKTPVTQSPYPIVSDQEVFEALNVYREVHGSPSLHLNQHLCDYASKRVADLVKFGGLDEHAGFKKDFADLDNLPASIQAYSGHTIAENLAHQNCKNMRTGDSFIVETGTALIEWCFDSSTKGHRETQLNPNFKNVCIRHGNNMYVVMFGD